MSRTFQKRVEDFTCGHCGFFAVGNGYTNHCPKCLWSLHIDVYPGDRAALCKGLMRPIGWTKDGKHIFIVQQCEACKHIRRNKVSDTDAMEAVIALPQRPAD